MITTRILCAFAATAMLLTPVMASAQSSGTVATPSSGTVPQQLSQSPSYSYPMTEQHDLAVNTAPGPGNNAAAGRFYDEQDEYLDFNATAPLPGAPVYRDAGGAY
jgi:hypothetical protein